MFNSKIPKDIVVGRDYTTSWANKASLKWRLIDITNNIAYLNPIYNGKVNKASEINTHINNLRDVN